MLLFLLALKQSHPDPFFHYRQQAEALIQTHEASAGRKLTRSDAEDLQVLSKLNVAIVLEGDSREPGKPPHRCLEQ